MKINLITNNLAGQPETHWNYKLSSLGIDLEIVYGYPNEITDKLIVTDDLMFTFDESYKNVYGLLVEPPVIFPEYYSGIDKIKHKFIKILTHNKYLIDKYEECVFYPHGDCYSLNTSRLDKTKLVSIIASSKNYAPGHILRHEVLDKFKGRFDFYGNPRIDTKDPALFNYMFSVVIENCSEDYYFTEKIIDCFRTRTIPIYWGCPSIHNFFDIDGIIKFNDIKELDHILSNINVDCYKSMIESVDRNYNKSFMYDNPFCNLPDIFLKYDIK